MKDGQAEVLAVRCEKSLLLEEKLNLVWEPEVPVTAAAPPSERPDRAFVSRSCSGGVTLCYFDSTRSQPLTLGSGYSSLQF